MKVFIGLGNPGKEYEKTRHNAGFMFIDFIIGKLKLEFKKNFKSEIAEIQINGEKLFFLKPQTYMNNSGDAVSEICKFYKLDADDIFIVFDDLDIELGKFKIQKGKYPKVHNGVNDIVQKLGKDRFNFIRIGVDDRDEIKRRLISGHDYVLGKIDYDFNPVFEEIFKNIEILQNLKL